MVLAAAAALAAGAQEESPAAITGVVTSGAGPEAGVWVIAETGDLPTTFRKIVVTDDDGRFLLPELPEAGYSVWVRGYGLVDSTPVTAAPGEDLRLTAAVAGTPHEAAAVYPAAYWLSLIEVPEAGGVPRHRPPTATASARTCAPATSTSTTSRPACAATRSGAGSRAGTPTGSTTTRAPTRGTRASAWGSAGPR